MFVQYNEFSMFSCSHFQSFISTDREHIVIGAMSKRGQEATSNNGSPTAKAIPVNLVMRSRFKEENSSSSLGSRVNPGTDDERKRVCQAPGNCEQGNSKSEVENSQVSRQEKILQATKKLWQKDQTQKKREEIFPGTRETSCMCRVQKHGIHELCNKCNIFNGFIQDQCIDIGIF